MSKYASSDHARLHPETGDPFAAEIVAEGAGHGD
jgi:hypothetical protein